MLRWKSHPIVDEYPRSLLLPVIVLAVCIAVHFLFGGPGWALLAAAFLAVSLARYFLPTTCELSGDGARLRFLGAVRLMPWSRVRRVDVLPGAVLLSPFEKPSRLDSFRGVYMRLCRNADEVVSFVEKSVSSECRFRPDRPR